MIAEKQFSIVGTVLKIEVREEPHRAEVFTDDGHIDIGESPLPFNLPWWAIVTKAEGSVANFLEVGEHYEAADKREAIAWAMAMLDVAHQ